MSAPRPCLAITFFLVVGSLAMAGIAPATSNLQDQKKQTMQEARQQAANQLKTLALAMHNYHSDHKSFPPAALVSKDGKALLSWRVLLLPYLDEPKLFSEFKLTEPWDSDHNKKLLAKMPAIYEPVWGKNKERYATPWQVFHGPGAAFEGDKGLKFSDFFDGTSNTMLIVEGADLVPWTKPADLKYDPKKEVPAVGHMFPDIFLFSLADGSVSVGSRKADPQAMHAAIGRADGNVVDFEKIRPKNP